MNHSPKKIILLVVIVLSIVVISGYFLLSSLYKGYSEAIDNAVSQIEVPIAAVDIEENQEIFYDMITFKSYSKEELTNREIISEIDIIGKKAKRKISKGSPFFKEDLLDKIENIDY